MVAAIAQIVPVTANSRKNERNVVIRTVPMLLRTRRISGLRYRLFFVSCFFPAASERMEALMIICSPFGMRQYDRSPDGFGEMHLRCLICRYRMDI